MAEKKKPITNTERIFKTLARLTARYRKALDEFFVRKQDEQGVNKLSWDQWIAEIENDIASMPLTAKDGEKIDYNLNAPLRRAIERVGSVTREIYDEATSESIPLTMLRDSISKELDTRRQKYRQLYDKYRLDPNRKNIERETRRSEIYYEMMLVIINMFRDFLKDVFEPKEDEQSSKPEKKPKIAVRVVYHKKSITFIRRRKSQKPSTGNASYKCNGWNHKLGCACGWGPRPGKEGKPDEKTYTVTKKVWIPAIYFIPRTPKPPVYA